MKIIKVIEKSGAFLNYNVSNENVDTFIANIPNLGHGLPERTISYIDANTEEEVTEVLPQEYTVEIIDLDNNYDYLLQKCYENRRNAYGEIGAQLDEQFHDFEAWKTRIAAVKAQFPKPVQG